MDRWKTGLWVVALSVCCGRCVSDPSATTPLPRWVSQPAAVYSSDRYLTAVGEGDTMSAAETHAFMRLAGHFETRVQSTQRLSDRVRESFGRTDEYERESEYQSDIHLQTDQALLNVKVAEHFSHAGGRVYVLLVLDRAATAELYKMKIIDNADRILALIKPTPSKLVAYANGKKALERGRQNQRLIGQLAVIRPTSAVQMNLPYQIDSLQNQVAMSAGDIRFRVTVKGRGAGPLEQQIRGLMAWHAFTAGSPCDLCISGTLSIDISSFPRHDIKTVRYHVSVEVKDRQSKTLFTLQQAGRESHITEQEAYLRAERTIHQLIGKQLKARMEALFDKMVVQD